MLAAPLHSTLEVMMLPASWQFYLFGEAPVVNPQTGKRTGEWINPLTYDVKRVVGSVFDFLKTTGIWLIIIFFVYTFIKEKASK